MHLKVSPTIHYCLHDGSKTLAFRRILEVLLLEREVGIVKKRCCATFGREDIPLVRAVSEGLQSIAHTMPAKPTGFSR
jgi:hypothetical protein